MDWNSLKPVQPKSPGDIQNSEEGITSYRCGKIVHGVLCAFGCLITPSRFCGFKAFAIPKYIKINNFGSGAFSRHP